MNLLAQAKRILILGLSREGISTYKYLRQHFPEKILGIADQQLTVRESLDDENLIWHLGENYLQSLTQYDLIFRTPGISPYLSEMQAAQKAGVLFTSQTELFFSLAQGTLIGISGTKGKSTTAALVAHLLTNSLPDVRLGGNIGTPLLAQLEHQTTDTIHVCELSAHQLYDLKTSPQIAILLPITPEHLDYYPTFAAYAAAKTHLVAFQKPSDFLFFLPTTPATEAAAAQSVAHKQAITPDDLSAYQVILENYPLHAPHLQANAAAAIAVARHLGLSDQILLERITTFRGLPYRLEVIGEKNGVTYINDSLATTPESTIAALQAFAPRRIHLLVGGYDRNLNYQALAAEIAHQNVASVLLFPVTGNSIGKYLAKLAPQLPQYPVQTMTEVAEILEKIQQPGDVVLLSPGAASFNLFKDYKDRGDQFTALVHPATPQ